MIPRILKKMLFTSTFKSEKGRIRLFKDIDYILYHARSFAINFQKIGEKLGEDYLFELGYESGIDCAKDYIKHMKLVPGFFSQKAVIEMTEFLGVGQVEIIKNEHKGTHHHFIIHVFNNPAIEWGQKLYKNNSMVCAWFRGVFSGHVEKELGVKNVKFIETQCLRNGKSYCEWESKY